MILGMVAAVRQRVTVQPGGVVEVRSPELAPGAQADVIVLVEQGTGPDAPLSAIIGQAKGCYADANEVDAFIRGERDAWES